MIEIDAVMNDPQARFMSMRQKFRAFVGGFGSGKTWTISSALCGHAYAHIGVPCGYFAPTYGHIRDIFYPTVEEVAEQWGLTASIKQGVHEVTLHRGRRVLSTIICRSMDKPGDIVGFKIGKAAVDELDILPKPKAETAWRKIIARLRVKQAGLVNGVDVATTPEGFRFTYDQFVRQVRDKPELANLYGLVQASTYENGRNLPDDYIPSLRASYPPQLIDAYLDGKFVNLTSGAVYPNFDRRLNHTPERIRPGEALHIGMDFNVLNMTAIVSVIRDDKPLTLAEVCKVRDTPTMARVLRERFPEHPITIYPDASGGNTSSKDASESDLSILRQAGFTVRANASNPAVRDRVNSVNALILNGAGVRSWKVNTDACPTLTECIEQQAYDTSGEPDKSAGMDHAPDAAGYFLAHRWPIVKRTATAQPLRIF